MKDKLIAAMDAPDSYRWVLWHASNAYAYILWRTGQGWSRDKLSWELPDAYFLFIGRQEFLVVRVEDLYV